MSSFLGIEPAKGVCNNRCVATTEGELIGKWREALNLTQAKLASRCPSPLAAKDVSRYEKGPSRMAIDTLLNVIAGLKIAGSNDAERLSVFFSGPVDQTVSEEADHALRVVTALHDRLSRRRRRVSKE